MDKKDFNITTGSRIRQLREELRYTREQLAESADISAQFLADIEMGRKSMTIYTFSKLSRALNSSADYLLYGCDTFDSSISALNIIEQLRHLSPQKRQLAEQLLLLFIKGISESPK